MNRPDNQDQLPFNNKRALVTGASSGIGQAIAQALAAEGAQVHAVARGWATPIEGWHLHNADFTLEADVRRLAAEVSKGESTLDLVIHCAGALETGAVADFPIAQLDYLYQVNVRTPFLLTQLLLPTLTQSKGQIVFINSSAAVAPNTALAGYSSAKAALKSIADCLRLEVNANGVRVMSVYPGKTASVMQQRAHELAGKPYDAAKLMQPQDVAQMVLSALALPKTAEMTDLHIRPMQK
jgi:NAD(P)-dependent dehydrogenase (short-subunit alcohol dehydrogenase family)